MIKEQLELYRQIINETIHEFLHMYAKNDYFNLHQKAITVIQLILKSMLLTPSIFSADITENMHTLLWNQYPPPICVFGYKTVTGPNPRQCYINDAPHGVIDECPNSNFLDVKKNVCKSHFQSLVFDEKLQVYKNPDYWICNAARSSEINCLEILPYHVNFDKYSLSVLLDFREGVSNHFEEHIGIMTIILSSISLICLLFRLFVQFCRPSMDKHTASNRLQCNLVFALVIATLLPPLPLPPLPLPPVTKQFIELSDGS